MFSLPSPELEKKQDADLVHRTASYGITCLRPIEYFDQKACLIYIEMILLLVEKIRINWFPRDSQWKSFEAVQSREWKMSQKLHLKRPGNVSFELSPIKCHMNARCSASKLLLTKATASFTLLVVLRRGRPCK